MESYLLKVSLSLIILYGVFRLMLRYELNHQLNRFIGLACVLFSASFPFAELEGIAEPSRFSGTLHVVALKTADFQQTVSSAMPDNTFNVFVLLYTIGVGMLLLRAVIGLASLLKLYVNSPRSYKCGFTIVSLDKDFSPFTFFNVLFIGSNRIEGSDMEMMLVHEAVHRKQYHSIDVLVLEALTIIFWFHPLIWCFRRDIRAEHEYFADMGVLENGVNPIDYQLICLRHKLVFRYVGRTI